MAKVHSAPQACFSMGMADTQSSSTQRDLDTVMRTTFAARTFTDEPVDDTVIAEIMESARFAASGGNRQGWHVVVVRDPATRHALIDCGNTSIRTYIAQRDAGEAPLNTIHPSSISAEDTAHDESIDIGFWSALKSAPVLLVVAVDLGVVASVDAPLDRVGVVSGASIYPLVQNIALGARARGLGSAITTFVTGEESKAQELLGMPSSMAVAAVMPLGHPTKVLTKLSRKPVDDFVTLERYDGERLSAS